MNEVALGEATPATVRDVTHACQQFDAVCVITAGECDQRFAERQHQGKLRIRRPSTA